MANRPRRCLVSLALHVATSRRTLRSLCTWRHRSRRTSCLNRSPGTCRSRPLSKFSCRASRAPDSIDSHQRIDNARNMNRQTTWTPIQDYPCKFIHIFCFHSKANRPCTRKCFRTPLLHFKEGCGVASLPETYPRPGRWRPRLASFHPAGLIGYPYYYLYFICN